MTKELVTCWREHLLTEQHLSPSTVNGNLSAINGLFYFLGWEQFQARFLKIQRRMMFRDPARELTKLEYEKLVSTARELGKNRLALIMETICATGHFCYGKMRPFTLSAPSAPSASCPVWVIHYRVNAKAS